MVYIGVCVSLRLFVENQFCQLVIQSTIMFVEQTGDKYCAFA